MPMIVAGPEVKLGGYTGMHNVVSYNANLGTWIKRSSALRTKREDFLATARKLADVFLSLLPESGVPWWDFDAPKPCPYDASAATIAARGMQILYQLLLHTDKIAAEHYLTAGFKLIEDILRECGTPVATLSGGKVDWGKNGWETILAVGHALR